MPRGRKPKPPFPACPACVQGEHEDCWSLRPPPLIVKTPCTCQHVSHLKTEASR